VARLFVEAMGSGLPLPDELGWREAVEGLQAPGVVGGVEEEREARLWLCVVLVVTALRGGLLDRAAWPLDLAARLGRSTWPLDPSARPVRSTWPFVGPTVPRTVV